MKYVLLTASLAASLLFAVSASAASSWKPGTAFFIAESDANGLLEKTYDQAFCTGIPRFGHRGEFPYEEFIYFDCSTKLNGRFCMDTRYRAVKATRVNYFYLRLVRQGTCF